jgi:hypothetical protein
MNKNTKDTTTAYNFIKSKRDTHNLFGNAKKLYKIGFFSHLSWKRKAKNIFTCDKKSIPKYFGIFHTL